MSLTLLDFKKNYNFDKQVKYSQHIGDYVLRTKYGFISEDINNRFEYYGSYKSIRDKNFKLASFLKAATGARIRQDGDFEFVAVFDSTALKQVLKIVKPIRRAFKS